MRQYVRASAVMVKLVFSLIDWISDTRSQGCIDLQSLVKCLDYMGIVKLVFFEANAVCTEAYKSACLLHVMNRLR